MGHTALREHYGGSVELEIVANLTLGLPRGPGCARLWRLWTATPGLEVVLPSSAVHIQPGGEPQYVVVNDSGLGVESFDVIAGGDTHAVDPGEAAVCTYSSAGWIVEVVPVAFGSPLTIGRVPFSVTLTQGNRDFDLAIRLADLGWDGSTPVAAHVVLAGWLGASTTAGYAFDTGTLPAGSTLLLELVNGAQLTGHGGEGGRGGDAGTGLLAQVGGAGGTALKVRGVTTRVINRGTIQGGGGGGGGGVAVGGIGGGGGGGGCGYLLARGGAGGNPTLAAGGLGGITTPGIGGGSGATQGGTGGAPGAAGAAAGAAGGSPGLAIEGVSTVTFLVTGSIVGGTT